MQTERVTFLTSRDHKAALDAYATRTGQSVGNVVREATSSYIAQPSIKSDDEEVFNLALPFLEEALPRMQADLEAMRRDIASARLAIAQSLERAARAEPEVHKAAA